LYDQWFIEGVELPFVTLPKNASASHNYDGRVDEEEEYASCGLSYEWKRNEFKSLKFTMNSFTTEIPFNTPWSVTTKESV
jgi:hypothetical protein